MSTLFLKLQRYSKAHTNSSISTTPPQLDESSPSEASEYLQIHAIYISRNWSHWPTLLLIAWVYVYYFSRNYL